MLAIIKLENKFKFFMAENPEGSNFKNNDWDEETEQNWIGFWNLILLEDMRQNPEHYKKIKEGNNLKVDKNIKNTKK